VAGILEPRVGEAIMKPTLIALGLGALASVAFATMWQSNVRNGRLLEEWMGLESDAMSTRFRYFETLVKLQDSSASELSLGLLKLEYFRRYQLDAQMAYSRNYFERYRTAADKNLANSGQASALAAMASGAAALFASAEALLASLAALGVMATAWSGYLTQAENIHQNRQNAVRLRRALSELEALGIRLDDVRERVEAGSQADLQNYVMDVHHQLAGAHQEWLASAKGTGEAIEKMDEALTALRSRGGSKE
jgi:hypothetical protein